MTNKEISAWIDRHAGIGQRLQEIYEKLESQEKEIRALRNQYRTHESKLQYADTVLFNISRICMKSKNPEKTLETIYSLVMSAHKKLTNV